MKIKNIFIKLLCSLIPVKKWRKEFKDKLFDQELIKKQNTNYGFIYFPIYNPYCPPGGTPPEIFNKDGKKMQTFFIRDFHNAHNPYLFGGSNYILWDRYNFGLDTHFYTHDSVLETMGTPSRKFAWFMESEALVPNDYQIFDNHKGLNNEFELIFTHSERLLDKYDNARFLPSCAQVWFGTERGGGKLTEQAYQNKTKNISIVSSQKTMCDLHVARLELARKLKREGLADTFGDFDGGDYIKVAESLTNYRYSIAFENEITPYWFTEKITNCFASMTIPIYIGATKINQFFNPDGIIQIDINDLDNIDKILAQCCQKDYEQRLNAIKDNYNKVQKYTKPVSDLIYEEYLSQRPYPA